jgi:hypothetical protein
LRFGLRGKLRLTVSPAKSTSINVFGASVVKQVVPTADMEHKKKLPFHETALVLWMRKSCFSVS